MPADHGMSDMAARGPVVALRLRQRAILLVVLAALLWSTSGLVFRMLDDTALWRVVFWRSSFLVPFLLLLIRHRGGGRMSLLFRAAGWQALLAGLFLGAAFTLWVLAIGATSVANANFIYCCAPIFAMLLARVFLGERLSGTGIVAIFGVVLGILIINAGAMQGEGLVGNLFALGTGVSFAAYTVTLRARQHVDMLPAVFFAALFSAFAGLVAMAGDIGIAPRDVLLCLILGVGQVGFGLVLFTAGARHLPTTELTLLSLIEVILSPVWVWLFMGETATPQTLLGGAVVLAAVMGPTITLLRQGAPIKTSPV